MDENSTESGASVEDGNIQEPGESFSLENGSAKAARVMRIKPPSRKSSKKQLELESLERRLEARIQDEVERRFSSAKDKRWAELERQYGKLSSLSARAVEDPDPQLEPASEDPSVAQVRRILQQANLENDSEALRLLRQARGEGPQAELRLLADLAGLALQRLEKPAAKASTVILPSGSGLPAADLRGEYEKRLKSVRGGDVAGLVDLKREFRKKGLEVW